MNKVYIKDKIESFEEYLKHEEKSNSTIDKYLRDVRLFISIINNEEITKDIVIKFKKYLINNYKPRSVNSILAAINSFFKYLERYDLLIKPIKIQTQQFRDNKICLTKKEYSRMIERTGKAQTKMIIKTFVNLGIRVSEIKYLTVEAIKEGEFTVNNKGKIRVVYIPKVLRKELLNYCKKEEIKKGSIFVNKRGEPLNRVTIWRKIKQSAKKSGVSEYKAFPHNFRHLYAVIFYNKSKDINLLANILGHSNINTTVGYVQEDKKTYIEKIEQVFSCVT